MVSWKKKCFSCGAYFLQKQNQNTRYCEACLKNKKTFLNCFSDKTLDKDTMLADLDGL